MDNQDNILDDDLRQLKDGAAELRKKLGGQTIISDFGACTDAVRKVSGLKKDYLTNAVTLLLFGAPATAFILKTSCGFSWWFCGALWVLMGILAPADSFHKFRMLQKIDFTGDSMLECGRKLAAYKTYFMKGRKNRWPAAVLFALWAIAEALFVVPEEARKDTLIILASTASSARWRRWKNKTGHYIINDENRIFVVLRPNRRLLYKTSRNEERNHGSAPAGRIRQTDRTT